ncbi:DUF6804 family protein [Chitinophaga vietnamensis]|uniref:DUF6804 family protein n=1 Tax=Chitinophaga vietnamensis TaxID=2593957 RepID=UPI003743C83F
MNRSLVWLLKGILIVLCTICLFRMPYGYYVFFRYVSFAIFSLFCIDTISRKQVNLSIAWGVSALMCSPFVKLPLGRTIWNSIDIIWIIIIFGSLIFDIRTRKEER